MKLPGILQEISDVAGEDAAVAIARAVGGTRQYIPSRAGPNHWLVRTVGREKADKICRHFALETDTGRGLGNNFLIPLGPAGTTRGVRRQLAQALDKGVSTREAARVAGVHERTAWRMKAKLRNAADSDQGELF